MKKILVLLLALHFSEGLYWKPLKKDGQPGELFGSNQNSDENPRNPLKEIKNNDEVNVVKEGEEGEKDKGVQNGKEERAEGVRKLGGVATDDDADNKILVNTTNEFYSSDSFQGNIAVSGRSGSQDLARLVSQFVPTDFITRLVMDQFIPRNLQDLLGNFAGIFGMRAGVVPSLGQLATGFFDIPANIMSALLGRPNQQVNSRKRNPSLIEQIIEVVFDVVQGITDFIGSAGDMVTRILGLPPFFNKAIKGLTDQKLLLTKNLLTNVARDVLRAGFKPFMGLGKLK